MDNSLDDSLNLESAMGVDFEQSEDIVVGHADITLDPCTSNEEIPMEFEQIEEPPLLMDESNEIIVPEYIDEQFDLQEYNISQTSTAAVTVDFSTLMTQSDTMIDMQFEPIKNFTPTSVPIKKEIKILPKIVSVKTDPTQWPNPNKKLEGLRQPVAIAPKPRPGETNKSVSLAKKMPIPNLVQRNVKGNVVAIAPKPRPGQPNKLASKFSVSPVSVGLVKKMPISNLVQGSVKGNVVGSLGKQLIMMPAGGNQKIKFITTSGKTLQNVQYIRASNTDQAQLIATKAVTSQASKQILTKFIVQGEKSASTAEQPAVITKLPAALVPVQHSSVPVSIRDKVYLTSPTKQAVSLGKNQELVTLSSPSKQGKTHEIFAIKTTPKLMPATSQISGTNTKKVVITSNPKQNVILKAAPKTIKAIKDGEIINLQTAQSQIHQINVPGKGIQFIKLLTPSSKPVHTVKSQPATTQSKTFVLADTKGNFFQVAQEKSGQLSPLVVNAKSNLKKLGTQAHKLVTIAPIGSKPQTVLRASQSLLAPRSPPEPAAEPEPDQELESEPEIDTKAKLRALLAETAEQVMHSHEVEIEFEAHHGNMADESMAGEDQLDSSRSGEHPLIVIPTNYDKDRDMSTMDDSQNLNLSGLEGETTIQQEPSREQSENELNMRMRKACNCTKSQCLKLYCDCFANGEFCHNCNCINCYNNLDNESVRHRAIRGCLDRNPNAFRPKIGKAKVGGPDIVRRHNKGCNCKRSGCLKNYCECYEARIACNSMCKCVGCRNVEDSLERARRDQPARRAPDPVLHSEGFASKRQPCNFMTSEVIEAVCQCLLAAAVEPEGERGGDSDGDHDPVRNVLDEFARCLQDVISAAQHAPLLNITDEGNG